MPRPSLSLHPSQGVSLGDPVTLRCHLPRLSAWVRLYREGGWFYSKGKKKEQDAAEFLLAHFGNTQVVIGVSTGSLGQPRCQ